MDNCPYCEKPFLRETPDSFEACPSCGYRSAQVSSADGDYLIIDSKLPDMISRYRQLIEDDQDCVVVIDRRINQNQIAGRERRRTTA